MFGVELNVYLRKINSEHMKSYFRFLWRNKLYTAIEVVGMAIALSFVVFIGSFVIREYTTDVEIKRQGNIYIGHSERLLFGCATMKEQFEGKFPEVQEMCRMMNTHIFGGIRMTIQVGDYSDRQKASIVDENFFRLFPFPLELGTPETALKDKNSVVVSRTFVNKVFGTEDPIGKSLVVDVNGKTAVLNITGVFSDFTNTIFYAPEIIYRIDLLSQLDGSLTENGNGSTVLFVKVAQGADVQSLEKKMETIVRQADLLYINGLVKDFMLTPFSEINACKVEYVAPFEGIVRSDFLNLFVAAGLFLLIFAVFNYVSLTVAQTSFRAKEMVSRRLLGSQQAGIIIRHIAESFVLTAISFLFAFIIVSLVCPYISELIGKEINPFHHFGYTEIIFILLIWVLMSVLSGVIPAILVSRYKPIDIVRGNFARTSKMILGKVLIGIQSGIAFITLVIATVMFIQLKHMTNKPMGYERENRICIQNASKPSDYYVEELKALACVEKVGWVQFEPMTLGTAGMSWYINGMEQKFDIYFGDQAAFDVIGFKILRQTGEPTPFNAWLPESTMRALGLDYDCTQLVFDNGAFIPICGIIEDYHKGRAEGRTNSDLLNLAWIKAMESEEDFRVLRTLVVKVLGDENQAADEIRKFYNEKGFSEDTINVLTFNGLYAKLYDTETKNLKLLAIFTMLTLLLTILALFAMSTYYTRQHAKEVALKKVLGGSDMRLFIEVSSGFLKSVIISVVVGIPIAWVIVGRWLEGYSYRVDNPIYVYVVAMMVMLLVAALSISWQMVNLINTNPVKSLKNE